MSVRPAGAADVAAMAEVQVQTWQTAYGRLLPPSALAAMDLATVEAGWRQAVERAAAERAQALVAVEDGRIVGLTGIGPATDDDLDPATAGEVGPLLVLPARQGAGHGSRLLAAATDLLRLAGLTRGVAWVFTGDTRTQAFLESAGWSADGATRRLDAGGAPVEELRFHTDLG